MGKSSLKKNGGKIMSRFMAVHTMAATKEQLTGSMAQLSKLPQGITWKQTYCDFAGNKFFCEWEAPSKEALIGVFKAVNTPFDAIYQVELIDIDTKKFR
jgi:hypothetical protein